MFSGTPNRTKFFSTGRHRSLSLEESAEDEVSPYGIGIEKDGNKPGRRRLNTYISSNNGLPMQRSLEESVDEDGAFAESESCSSTIVNAAQAQGLIAKSELAFFDFLRHHPSYELMPHSSKLVVFDTRLSGRKAFFAMMHNGVSAAMLWSSEKQTYVGVLTVCDFIRAICHQYTDGGAIIDDQCVESWLKFDAEKRRMVMIGPENSLARATSVLLSSRIRRLPVCDPASGNILCTIAHKHIARFIYANLPRLIKPRSWFKTLADVGIGTYTNIATVTPQTKIIDALRLLVDRHVSALPVISATDGQLIGVFSRSDAVILAVDNGYMNLDRPLSAILPHLAENVPRPPALGPLRVCKMDETLGMIVEKLVRGLVHRLIVVDGSRQVIGIVSLTDLLRFFIRAPPASSYLVTPGGNTAPVTFTASGYDLSNAPSLEQFPTSQSLISAPSPVACMSFASSNGSLASSTTSSRQRQNSIRIDPASETSLSEDMVSASLPVCPGPARHLAFAEISS